MTRLIYLLMVFVFLSFSLACHATSSLLTPGAGEFVIKGGVGREAKTITVFYIIPQSVTVASPILIALPGSRRDAENYRNYWLEASEQFSVVVVSPQFSKVNYPKSDNYNLAAMVLRENGTLRFNPQSPAWLFSDIDRIFDLVVKQTGSNQRNYDLFGHSAGGQLSHRLALFFPRSKAQRIVAANAGWYTVTDVDAPFPYGLAGVPFLEPTMQTRLQQAFHKHLTILLGDQDIATAGSIRRNKKADKQGVSRLQRGGYFYNTAQQYALNNGYPFNWRIKLVPGVGHSAAKMSKAAAKLLYGGE